MSRIGAFARRVAGGVLAVLLLAYAATVAHDFYSYVDRSIFVSVDDSEANIAYALATRGSYGFPVSPVLAGQDRSQYQFNYGPWYFYLAAALSWLFGFSLTLVRSLHLWGMFAIIGAAAWWFGGRERIAGAAVFALGLLYCFEASHWPMARPDIMVSVFAVVLVLGAGAGLLRPRALPWFGAGLGAACGAFTHLIAFSLVPAAVVLFAVATLLHWLDVHDPASRRRVWLASLLGLAAGGLAGTFMFYASFDFQFATQLRFLGAYRDLTASPVSPSTALGHHLTYAFGYLTTWQRYGAVAALVVALVLPAIALVTLPNHRRLIAAYLLPPAVVWSGYLITSAWYTNYHQGYAILHQVMFLWTVAAIAWLVLHLARERFPLAGALVTFAVTVLLIAQTGRLLQWQLSGESWKHQRVAIWVPFAEYSARVLEAIPARATAWGSIILGLEAPDRIQLVQWSDAAGLFTAMPANRRAPLVPDYIVWAYPEMRDNMLSVTRGNESLLARTSQLVGPDHRYRVVSLVSAAPYGVTRTYARRVGPLDPDRSVPAVSVYDAHFRRWLTRRGQPLPNLFVSIAPIALNIGYEQAPPASTPANTVSADLPADRYLLRVQVKPGAGDIRGRLLAATSPNMVRQTMGEGGPDGDYASYLDTDTDVYMLVIHTGGPLYVSQFDAGPGAAIVSVTATPIVGLLDPTELPRQTRDLPALSAWTATPGVTLQPEAETLRITGDDTAGGYQLVSPLVSVRQGNRVTVRTPVRVETGAVCAGALNATGATWLVPPDIPRAELRFSADATEGFRVVFANCNPTAGVVKSQFVVWPGDYLDEAIGASYAASLVEAAFDPVVRIEERAGPEVRTVPPGLVVARSAVEGPYTRLVPDDFGYRAGIVTHQDGTWTVQGRAEGGYTYLLQSKTRRLEATSRVLIAGRVERGGITVGLLQNNQWVSQLNLSDPGDFTVVMAPPRAGEYSIMIANNLPQGLDTSIVLNRFGMLPDALR